ncbi:hypothetical protein G5I_08791 [Acromyrmex echinatior]|uniref:Uncharacterized protein n=1 Tax=Acromyrmex echinatior TaxID=103372 RepID=F4WSG0_ACREC|nr:hypothetical protein G5I_08791 [Acromyrmex echinatior]
MTMHDPRNVVRGLGCMVRSIEWARYSDSLKRSYRHECDKCPRCQREPERGRREKTSRGIRAGVVRKLRICGLRRNGECEPPAEASSNPGVQLRPDFALPEEVWHNAESILQKNCNTDRKIGKKRMALAYHHKISKKKKRAGIPRTNRYKTILKTEEERLPEADSCRKEKQAAVKSGRIPEERVGKKRAPASGRDIELKQTREDARKGRKKRQSANLHANDEAVLIIRRVSVGRDTTLSRK